MIDSFRKLFDLLDRRERRNAIFLFIMMLAMGLFELAGVASIMPFIAVLSNPEIIKSHDILSLMYEKLGFVNNQDFLLFLGAATFILVMGSLSFKALTFWAIARFTNMRGYTISCRLLRGCLNQPYPWFLNRHSVDLGKSILSEVDQVINGSLMPALRSVAQSLVSIFLIILVVAVEPSVAMISVIVIGGSYVLIYAIMRHYLSKIGADRLRANQERFQITQEALGGIKDVKILGLEDGYISSFRKPAAMFAKRMSSSQIIGALPHFLLQGIAFGGIVLIILILLVSKGDELSEVLPMMALFAFAGARLLPAMQQVYNMMTKIRFSKPTLDLLHKDLQEVGEKSSRPITPENAKTTAPIKLNNVLELRKVSYTYPKAQTPTLKNFNLRIMAGTTVALVGSTGSGKTTVADLLLGLLESQEGGLYVDGQRINHPHVRAWQCNIGYVPQYIFLADDTVASNIAFGQTGEIDMNAVERASRIAELHDFVLNELPMGYQTTVGERGVRLSGGQRQRIGIARAIYLDPEVLILDEATSALDNLTERAFMNSVHNIGHRKTIIVIAHRLTTVKQCDQIHFLEQGHIRTTGTYQELVANDRQFQEMVRANASS